MIAGRFSYVNRRFYQARMYTCAHIRVDFWVSSLLSIPYPEDLLNSLSEIQLQQLAREAFYVRLYEQGLISSGRAGAMLGMDRSDFLNLLGQYGDGTRYVK